jgi:ATP-dependent Clp protease ATP-binding subunit ClpC
MAAYFDPDGLGQGSFDEYLARLFGSGDGVPASGRRVDIGGLLTEPARQLLAAAMTFAREQGHDGLDSLHVLWAATQTEPTRTAVRDAGVDADEIAAAVQELLPAAGGRQRTDTMLVLTQAAQRMVQDAYHAARVTASSLIAPEHLLVALSANGESEAGQVLGAAGLTPEGFRSASGSPGERSGSASSMRRKGNTPTLDQYGQDLTARARDGGLDPVVGRDQEIEQTIEVLSRRTKNNPVLIGEAGVGKTAIVEGIAQRIADESVPAVLADKRVVQLELSGLLAGARYRGDFEERMTKVIDEISRHRDEIIVFIDELHTVVGAGGSEGAVDAGNMLKPRLARGELHVMGATTADEYRKNIEQDSALERRFQPVWVPEPSVDDTIAMLTKLQDRYEAHHRVQYTHDAVAAAATLSDRYVSDRFLPDKAIDLLDQAGARKRLKALAPDPQSRELAQRIERLTQEKDQAVAAEQYERASQLRDEISVAQAELTANSTRGGDSAEESTVTGTDIAEVVSRTTGVPVHQLTETEKARLQHLEQELHQRVIGQDDAVHALARAVRRSRSGLGSSRRPVGSFLFLGPTGVGKTELAKALAESLFGSDDRMVRVDMSEFQEPHTVSRLIGATPGYVGYGDAAQLTEPVRRRPYSVVLLDEIEKAHANVFNLLLQVLDDGRLTDGQGRTVDFSNTVLIMTSNLGSEIISSRSGGIGFSTPGGQHGDAEVEQRLWARLRDEFRPEFLNRLDQVVVFRRLESEQLQRITDLLLDDTRTRLGALDIDAEFSTEAVDWLAHRGHQPEFGARPLRHIIEREVDDRISDLLLDDVLQPGQRLQVDVRDDELHFETSEPARQSE